MARKKSEEELALEAELAAGAANKRTEGSDKANGDVALPEVEKPSRKKTAGQIKVPSKLSFLNTLKGKVIAAASLLVVVIAVIIVVLVVRWNSTDVWDGTQDTSWFDASNSKSSYTITTAEQLAGVGKLIEDGNFFEGVTLKLGCNLDMYDIEMAPIASGRTIDGVTYKFCGNLDGQGHTVKGLNVMEDEWDYAGLFGATENNYIKDLTVEGKVTGQVTVGGIVGFADATTITNCTNRCQVSALKTATSFYSVSANCGGIVGEWLAAVVDDGVSFELSDLVNEGKVSARAASVGGVIGLLANSNGNTLTVSNLTNKGDVELFAETEDRDEGAGGVIGVVNEYGDFTSFDGLTNDGNVACSSVLSVGGVFGAYMLPQDSSSVASCTNNGRISANVAAEDGDANNQRGHVGGIFGYIDDPANDYSSCANSGELAATNGNTDDVFSANGREVWDEWEIANPKTY